MRVNPEKKEEKERVSAALLRATLHLAAEHGFTSLGLREVSRAADIAPTSFYRHFADMEALGLALIEDLARPFVRSWVDRAQGPHDLVAGLATAALAAVDEDPELMRFIVAERVGAIPSFRKALRNELSAISTALRSAIAVEHGTGHTELPQHVADAAAALVLEACARGLERTEEPSPAVERERLALQLGALLSRPRRGGASP